MLIAYTYIRILYKSGGACIKVDVRLDVLRYVHLYTVSCRDKKKRSKRDDELKHTSLDRVNE